MEYQGAELRAHGRCGDFHVRAERVWLFRSDGSSAPPSVGPGAAEHEVFGGSWSGGKRSSLRGEAFKECADPQGVKRVLRELCEHDVDCKRTKSDEVVKRGRKHGIPGDVLATRA